MRPRRSGSTAARWPHPALGKVLANDDRYFRPETRAAAARALGALLPPGEGGPLCAAAADPEATVSLAAIAALADTGRRLPAPIALLGVDRAGRRFLPAHHAPRSQPARSHGCTRHDPARLRTLVDREPDPEVRTVLESLASRPS